MNGNEQLYYSLAEGKFSKREICNIFQELMDEYNKIFEKKEINESDLEFAVRNLIIYAEGGTHPNEIFQAMLVLLLTLEKRVNSRTVWVYCADAAFHCGDLEICRELVIFAIGKAGKGDVRNANREFIKLSEEDKEQNVADILGMVVEELERENSLDEGKYKNLLNDFAKPLEQWRNLEVPKSQHKGSYDLVYQIVECCYRNKAYRTALRLSGLLFISDQTENKENLPETIFLMGKVTYELGHLEVAKRCFLFADEETKGECWNNQNKKYRTVLGQETKLELTAEIIEKDRELQEKIDSGELKLYTSEEVNKYRAGELDIPFVNLKKQKKSRMKTGEKAIKKYEKYAQGSMEERMKGIEDAFSVFTEKPEVYEAAAYLYYLKANLFISQNDFETAYEYFQTAYGCENGKRNGLVLLGTAIALSQMGRMEEAVVYLFRTYILCGKQFIVEKVGEGPWKMVKKYL